MGTNKHLSILHLEDEPLVVEIIELRLKHAGLEIQIDNANNETAFLQKFQTNSYDVILLDYQLPDFDGLTALKIVRQNNPEIPVIMVSGKLDEDSIITSLKLGATDYVLKDKMERLAPAVKRALKEFEQNQAHKATMQTLRDRETRLNDIAANLPGGLYQFHRHGEGQYCIPWCSKGFEELFNLSAADVVNNIDAILNQIQPEHRNRMLQDVEQSAAALSKWENVFKLETRQGARWLHIISVPRKLDDGSVLWNGMALDITEQKQQENELTRYRDQLQEMVEQRTSVVKQQAQIIEQIHDAVISVDMDGNITSWNKGAERIFGYNCDEIVGHPFIQMYCKQQRTCSYKQILTELLRQGELEIENYLIRKNGNRFNAHLSLSLMRNALGDVQGMICYAMDISKMKRTEEALKDNEARYRTVIETAVDGIITIDKRGIIESFNPAAENIFGYDEAEILGKNISLLMPQSYRSHHDNYIQEYVQQGGRNILGVQREVRGLHKNGTIIPLQMAVSKMYIAGKIKFTGMVRNITQIKQAKEALLNSERFSRNILNSMPDNIAVLNEQGVISQINNAWEEFAEHNGSSATDTGIGCSYLNVCSAASQHEEDFASKAYNGIKAVLEKQQPLFTMEYASHSPTEQHWFLMSVVPLLGGAGGAVVAHSDITERILTEHALQESEQRLKDAQRIGRMGNWRWDVNTGKLFWSEEIYRIYDRDPSSFLPTAANFYATVYPADLEIVQQSEQQSFKQAVPHSIDHRIVLPDGKIRWVHEEAVPILDEYGNPYSLIGTVHDITERKEFEAQLIEAKETAEQASRAKSEFLSSMSHELRTPLNAILGYTQLMQMDSGLNDEQIKSIGEINKAGNHLLHLISDLLDLAKIEAGRMQLQLEDLSLYDIIEECHQLMLPAAQQKNVNISQLSIKNDSDIAIHADRVRLKQIILNLMSNAVKYNRKQGELSIEIKQLQNHVRLSMKDTGPGIAPEKVSELFNAFNRLGAESSAIEGTGIGLVIAKNLIELMNGHIGVESNLGRGSNFWIDIPLAGEINNKSFDSMAQSNENDAGSVNDTSDYHHNGQYTVLYIEDNPANMRLVEIIMKRRSGLKLLTATTPQSGLEIAFTEQPDLILLDITLPDMDGYEVLKHLQANNNSTNIPVIAVSANAMSRDIERGMKAGFVDYVTKPINVNRLLTAVDHHLSLQQGAA